MSYVERGRKCFVKDCPITRYLVGGIVKDDPKEKRVWVCQGHQWMTKPIPRPQRPGKEASA